MNIKSGMCGSNGGRSRREPTETLKQNSKAIRRRLDRFAVHEQLMALALPDTNDDQEENRFVRSWTEEDDRKWS